MSKIIGTFVPLSSLISETTNVYGVIENGIPFIDWLVKTKQSAWQMLPLHETQLISGSRTEHVPSPYKGYGIGIDPRYLSEAAKELRPTDQELKIFIKKESAWIHDYALFCALRDEYGTDDWREWDDDLRKRNPKALEKVKSKKRKEIDRSILQQWQLHVVYMDLKMKADEYAVTLIGDIPFYLSVQSPLVWTYQACFVMNNDYSLPVVSGVVNQTQALFGRQIWGHPLYNWEDLSAREQILDLWKLRISYTGQLFQMLRFDHTNGFFLYGSIDIDHEENDLKKEGPGEAVFTTLVEYARSCVSRVYAEDAANDLDGLRRTMRALDIPGVRTLRYAYNENTHVYHTDYIDPTTYPTNSVAYTTTHDTEPLVGFLKKLSQTEKEAFAERLHRPYTDDHAFALLLREMVLKSPADTVIIPIQDWLLTADRINVPGTEDPIHDMNWHYQLEIPIEQLPVVLDNTGEAIQPRLKADTFV